MAKSYILTAQLEIQGIRFKKNLNDVPIKINNLDLGQGALKDLRAKISQGIKSVQIHKIWASNIAIANLKRQLQKALKDLGTFTFEAKVNTRGQTQRQGSQSQAAGPNRPSQASRNLAIRANLIAIQARNVVLSGTRVNNNQIGSVRTTRGRTIQEPVGLLGGPNVVRARVISGFLGGPGGGAGGGGGGGGGGAAGGPQVPGVPFRPKSFADIGIKEAIDDLRVFGRQAGNTLRRFIAYNVVSSIFIGISNSMNEAISKFIEFDRELVRIAQVTRGTNAEINSVEQTVRGLSSSLGVSSIELLKSAETLAQAGISIRDLPDILNAVAKSDLAPTFGSMAETTEGLIAIIRQFNLEAKDSEAILGSINIVAAKFAVESEDILVAVRRAGGAFAAASDDGEKSLKTFQQFIATFTAIRSVTRESAESIATGLRTITTRLQRPTSLKFLEERGIQLTDENDFIGLFNALKILNEEFTKLQANATTSETFGILEEIGGFRQVSKLLPLLENFGIVQESFAQSLLGINSLSIDAIKAQDALSIQFDKTRESFNNLVADFLKGDSFKSLITTTLTVTNLFIRLGSVVSNLAVPLGLIGTALAARPLGRIGLGVLEGIGGRADAFGRTVSRGRGQGRVNTNALLASDPASAFLFSQNTRQAGRSIGTPIARLTSGLVDPNAPRAVQVFQSNLQNASRAFVQLQTAQLAYAAAVRSGATNQAELRFAVDQAAQSVANFSYILDRSQQRAIAAQGGDTFLGRARRGAGRFFSRNRNALLGGGIAGAGILSQLLPEDTLGPITTSTGRAFGLGQGIAGGAATGAILGSVLPGLGTAIGATAGALIGLAATIHSQNKELEQIKFQENATKFAETFNKLDVELSKITNPVRRQQLLLSRFGSTSDLIRNNFPIISADNRATNVDQLNTLLQRGIQSASPVVLKRLAGQTTFFGQNTQTTDDLQAIDDLVATIRGVGIPVGATTKEINLFDTQLRQTIVTLSQVQLIQTNISNIVSKFTPELESFASALENAALRTSLAGNILESFGGRIGVGNIGQISSGSSNSLTRQFIGNAFTRGDGFDSVVSNLGELSNNPDLVKFNNVVEEGQRQLFDVFNELIATNFKAVDENIRNKFGSGKKIEDATINAATIDTIISQLNGNVLLPIIRESLNNIEKSGLTVPEALGTAADTGQIRELVRDIFRTQIEQSERGLREVAEVTENFFNQVRQQELQAFQSNINAFRLNIQAQEFGQAAIRTRSGDLGLSLGQENELFRQRQSSLTGGNFNISDLGREALLAANSIDKLQNDIALLTAEGKKANIDKVKDLQKQLNDAQFKLENFTDALKAYGDIQNQNAAITRDLNNLEKQKQGLIGVAERLLTGDPQEVGRLQSGFNLATRVTDNGGLGNLRGISRDGLKSVLDALSLVGNLEFAGRGISGNELRDRILLNSFPGNVAQGLRGQEQGLLGQQANLQDQAQLAFIELARVNTALAEQTRQQNLQQTNEFLNALRLGINAQQVIVNGPITNGNGFAAGGFVSGRPGRDKIPAMLSDGEFVVNKNAASKFGPFLQNLNNGFNSFANGGVVTPLIGNRSRPITANEKRVILTQQGIPPEDHSLYRVTRSANGSIQISTSGSETFSQKYFRTGIFGSSIENARTAQKATQVEQLRQSRLQSVIAARQAAQANNFAPQAVPFGLDRNIDIGLPQRNRQPLPFPSEISSNTGVGLLGGNDLRRNRLRQQRQVLDFLAANNPNVARRSNLRRAFDKQQETNAARFNENRSNGLILDLARRGIPVDDVAVQAARDGKSRAEILSGLANRSVLGQVGRSAVANGAVTTDRISDQLGKVAQQLNDAASKIPNQIDIKVGDVNVNITGLDPLKIFNDKFLDTMATEVADRIRAQGQKQFGRKPN